MVGYRVQSRCRVPREGAGPCQQARTWYLFSRDSLRGMVGVRSSMVWQGIQWAMSPLLRLFEWWRREKVRRDESREKRIEPFVGDFLARQGGGFFDVLESGVRRLETDAEVREAFKRIEVATGGHPLLPSVAALFRPDDDLASFFRSLTPEDKLKASYSSGLEDVIAKWRQKQEGSSKKGRKR